VADNIELEILRSTARRVLGAAAVPPTLAEMGNLGWLALLVDEDSGGAGWRPVEACLIAEELGRAHDPSPWVGTVLAAAALSRSSDPSLRDRWLPGVLDGAALGAFCGSESGALVVDADRVDVFVTAGSSGLAAFDAGAFGKGERDPSVLDTTRAVWRVKRGHEPGVRIGDADGAAELLAVGRLLVSADALGALSGAVERLVAHLRDRVAFGAPIASFQAVQHRLVDLVVLEVRMSSIIGSAARALAQNGQSGARLATVAHAFVASNAAAALDECIQLSGGIGFTWDYPLHHEMRRALADAALLGSARSSRARLAEIDGW